MHIPFIPVNPENEFRYLENTVPNEDNQHLFMTGLLHPNQNRYANIIPFDKTIVKMKGSEYINASYVTPTLPKDSIRFICTQAPKCNTLVTYYKMIWEHKVPVIVMLTNLFEAGVVKAQCYWPTVGNSVTFGEITIKTESEETNNLITIRKIKLTKGNKTRTLSHIQYLEWPDHGAPKSSLIIRNLIKVMETERIENSLSLKNDHIIVHCSAGVGRTGTFIAIYTALKYIDENKPYNIKKIVENLREQRMYMVQSPVQYQFIFQAVEEYKNFNRSLSCSSSAGNMLNQSNRDFEAITV